MDAWARVPLDEFLNRVEQVQFDIGRALKLQNADRIGWLGVATSEDPEIPPTVCSKLLDVQRDLQ